MATQIKLRRDTAANWASANTVLSEGEPGYDLTNKKLKIGDGVTSWSTLAWFEDTQNLLANANIDQLSSGDMYFTQTTDTVSLGQLAAQNITVGPAGIQLAGTGGVKIMGVIGSTVTLGGQTSGNIIFQSPTSGISYNDLNDTPAITSTGNFVFDGDNLTTPASGSINQNNSFTKVTTPVVDWQTPTVVWSSTYNYISSAKLIIQVEASEQGDNTGWHSQACEAIIASRGYGNGINGYGEPAMTVYGVVHTSVDPLVTFTVQRNPTTRLIEVVGTLTGTAGGAADLRIHSVEMSTRD